MIDNNTNLRQSDAKSGLKVHEILFFLLAVLLPFSTGNQVAVVTYAAPVMFLLGLYYVVRFATIPRIPNGFTRAILLVGLLQICWMILLCVPGEKNYPRIARVVPHMFGWLVLFYMTSEVLSMDRNLAFRRARQWSGIFVLSAGVLAFYYIANIAMAAAEYGLTAVVQERYVSGLSALPWGASNTVASTLLFGYSVCVVSYVQCSAEPQANKHVRFLGLRYSDFLTVMLVVISAGIFATISRNGIATWGIASLPLVTRRWIRPAFVFGVLGFALYWFVSSNEELAYKIFAERTAGDNLSSYNNREDFWIVFATYWYANPFSPIGFYNCLYHFGFSAHNVLLTTLVEQSAIAVGMLLLTWAILYRSVFRLYSSHITAFRKAGIAYLLGASAIVVNSNFEDAQYTQQYVVSLWLWMACLLVQLELAPPLPRGGEFGPRPRMTGPF